MQNIKNEDLYISVLVSWSSPEQIRDDIYKKSAIERKKKVLSAITHVNFFPFFVKHWEDINQVRQLLRLPTAKERFV